MEILPDQLLNSPPRKHDNVWMRHDFDRREVEVVTLVPGEGIIPDELMALKAFESFTLAGIAGLGNDGRRKSVWVHSKLIIVDDVWATVGSCNLHHASLFGNCELNAAFWHADTARALRVELLQEHLDHDAFGIDDRAALRIFRQIAMENRAKSDNGEHAWRGLAISLGGTPSALPVHREDPHLPISAHKAEKGGRTAALPSRCKDLYDNPRYIRNRIGRTSPQWRDY